VTYSRRRFFKFSLWIKSTGIYKKFQKLAALSPEDREAQEMVQVEDWVNDGVALPSKVVDVCFQNWFQLNQPAKGSGVLQENWSIPKRFRPNTSGFSAL